MRILMSAAASTAAPSFIQHLQSLGHQVIGIDSNPHAVALGTHFCDHFYLCPPATSAIFPEFVTSLNDEFDLYIPFIDEELSVLSGERIPATVRSKVMLCPAETIALCNSKKRFQDACETLDLPIAPRAQVPPAIYKPEQGRGGRGVLPLDDQILVDYYQSIPGVVQQRLDGTEYTVDVLTSKQGEWLFGVGRKRLQASGVSTIAAIDCEPAVMALAQQAVESFNFRYAINIQIMLLPSGEARLIEINPRLAGSALFSIQAGFDILDLATRLFCGEEPMLPSANQIKPLRLFRYWQEWGCD